MDPNPPTANTFRDVLKIMIAFIIWYAMTDANHALMGVVDFANLPIISQDAQPIVNATVVGLLIGVLQGIILGIKAIVFLKVGPTFFEYLAPVVNSFLKIPLTFIGNLRKAWRGDTGTKPGEPKK
jgi:hypothetical protein